MLDEKNIQTLIKHGYFSELDVYFAGLMTRISGQESPGLFLAAALVSRATSQGHVCLDLSSLNEIPLIVGESGTEPILFPPLPEWQEILVSSSVVGRPGDYRPLIFDDRTRLYLYRYWEYEKTLANTLAQKAALKVEKIDVPLLRKGISRLFSKDRTNGTDWQKVAAFVSVMKKFCVISGGPGTGKSTLIAKILALILEQTINYGEIHVALAAPTGKAAARLQEAVNKAKKGLSTDKHVKAAIIPEASTIHRLLGTINGSPYFRHNAENLLPFQLVVIDEASMVDLALMSKLVRAIPSASRLILLGDRDQLASVEAGAVLGDICNTAPINSFSKTFSKSLCEITGENIDISQDTTGSPLQDCVVQLQKNYRFGIESGIGKVSTTVNKGDGDLALDQMKGRTYHDIAWKALPTANKLYSQLKDSVLRGYKPYLTTTDPFEAFQLFEQFRIMCTLRKGPYGVLAVNHLVEQILQDNKLINLDMSWYKGRPVLITRNDYEIGLFNGDICIILPDPESNSDLRAFFVSQDRTLRKFLPFRLPEHETAYAMTVHKSQGSEFENALLLLPDRTSPVMTRELIYTGITRAKKSVEVWGREPVFLEGIKQRTFRASGLRDALRY
jgi:exodeoxyribonuclease V alpha subunit